jgi:hypothetical protein
MHGDLMGKVTRRLSCCVDGDGSDVEFYTVRAAAIHREGMRRKAES